MQTLRTIALAVLLPMFFAVGAEADEAKPASKPSLTYYYYDGWPLCAKITVIVNDQKAEHADKINIQALNVRSEEAAADLAEAEFVGGHGIIARDKEGKMLTKVDGHSYDKTKVEEVVELLLEKG